MRLITESKSICLGLIIHADVKYLGKYIAIVRKAPALKPRNHKAKILSLVALVYPKPKIFSEIWHFANSLAIVTYPRLRIAGINQLNDLFLFLFLRTWPRDRKRVEVVEPGLPEGGKCFFGNFDPLRSTSSYQRYRCIRCFRYTRENIWIYFFKKLVIKIK